VYYSANEKSSPWVGNHPRDFKEIKMIFAAFDSSIVWPDLISNFGPLVGIVLFFIWRDWKREDALSSRLEKLEDYQRETLINLVERSTTALAQNAECLTRVVCVVEKLCTSCPYVTDCKPESLDDGRNK
jgi:hypothetical protein